MHRHATLLVTAVFAFSRLCKKNFESDKIGCIENFSTKTFTIVNFLIYGTTLWDASCLTTQSLCTCYNNIFKILRIAYGDTDVSLAMHTLVICLYAHTCRYT